MNALRAIVAEVIGLFVDDGSLALLAMIWLAVCGGLVPKFGWPSFLPPLLLFAGLVALLAISALRRAGKR